MSLYLILFRGINVGGKNKVPMAGLKACLMELGCKDVRTYINSGNVIAETYENPDMLARKIEKTLPKKFILDSELIRVLILSKTELETIVSRAPKGFGAHPDKYHSDAIFLMGINAQDAFKIFNPRVGVDKVWLGNGVIYSQRLSAERTKSRLSQIVASPLYKQMTIRSWSTTTKLLALMNS